MDEKPMTTGEIAAHCQVCPATVKKWIDKGLLEGYRLPGSGCRRVTVAALRSFLAAHGMPDFARNQP